MPTPESTVKSFVKKFLDENQVYYYMPVPNGYGAPSLDFHCTWRGYSLYIETKAPGKQLTPRQRAFFTNMNPYGAPCFMVSQPHHLKDIETWMATKLLSE